MQFDMKEEFKIYEIGRGKADNIKVIDKKLTLFVHDIDERTPQVIFVINPNLVEYRETQKSQSIGFEAINDTSLVRLSPNSQPIEIEIAGTVYTIAVDSIGNTGGVERWAYCNFVVSWDD
jgi:hypothetical protein